jgi:hypothetical protein
MYKLVMLSAVAALGLALTISALPASGQDTTPTGTLVLTGTERHADQKTIDLKPRGESVGDRIISAETLRRDGTPVAREVGECLLVDPRYEGAQCTFTIMFHDGIVIGQGASLSKRVPGVDPTNDEFAIVAGTGPYARASGTVKVQSTRTGHRVTITFAA